MFIQELKFIEKCQGFENGSSIIFGNNQKGLIDFYIKTNKKIQEDEKVGILSDRLQINCILGQNGAGKTRLLDFIGDFLTRPRIDLIPYGYNNRGEITLGSYKIQFPGSPLSSSYIYNGEKIKMTPLTYIKTLAIINDTFYIGSRKFWSSVNKKNVTELVNSKGLGKFYLEIVYFLQKETHKEIFSNFLNLDKDYAYALEVDVNNEFYSYPENKTGFSVNDYKNELLNFFKLLYFGIEGTKHLSDFPRLSKIFKVEVNILKKIWLNHAKIFLDLIDNMWGNLNLNSDFIVKEKITELNDFLDLLEIFKLFLSFLVDTGFSMIELDNGIGNIKQMQKDIKLLSSNLDIFISYINNLKDNGEITIIYSKKSPTLWENILFGFNLDDEKNIIYRQRYNELNDLFNLYMSRYNFNDTIKELNFNIDLNLIKLTQQEKEILSLPFLNIDLTFSDLKRKISFNELSSGEQIMLIRFVNIYKTIYEKYEKEGKKNFIILVDEPDLHLHLEWQQQYIQRLIDVFSTIKETDITMHFIIATHSPFIISDLPKENIIKLGRNKGGDTIQLNKKFENQKETFGANYIDIIRNGFFENGVLMGSFSADIIEHLSIIEKFKLLKGHINIDSLEEHEKKIYQDYVENSNSGDDYLDNLKKQIGDEFIKNNLLYINFKNDKNRNRGNHGEAPENEGMDEL